MALSDGFTITINGTGYTFYRIPGKSGAGEYRTNDGLYTLTVSHQEGKRRRTVVRLDKSEVIADPYATGRNVPIVTSQYHVFDTDSLVINGTGGTDQKNAFIGLSTWLQASTNAALIKIIAGEA